MRKYVLLLALGGSAGFPSFAMAADVVTVGCIVSGSVAPGGGTQFVLFSQASTGVTLPASCGSPSFSCPQCTADLLARGFRLTGTTNLSTATGTYLIFQRGGGD